MSLKNCKNFSVPENQVEFSKRLEEDTDEITNELIKWKNKTEVLDELIKSFYKFYDIYNEDLQGVDDNLMSQDRVSVENDIAVGHQLNELQVCLGCFSCKYFQNISWIVFELDVIMMINGTQVMKAELESAVANETKCNELISELKSLDSPEAVAETEKLMDDSLWYSFNMRREIEDREWLLKRAENLTKIYNDRLAAVSEWLPICEKSIDDYEDEIKASHNHELNPYNIKVLSLKSKTLKGLKDLSVLHEVCILAHRLDLQSSDTLLLEVTNLIGRCHIMFDKMNTLLKRLGGVEEEHLGIFKELLDYVKKQPGFSHSQLTYIKVGTL